MKVSKVEAMLPKLDRVVANDLRRDMGHMATTRAYVDTLYDQMRSDRSHRLLLNRLHAIATLVHPSSIAHQNAFLTGGVIAQRANSLASSEVTADEIYTSINQSRGKATEVLITMADKSEGGSLESFKEWQTQLADTINAEININEPRQGTPISAEYDLIKTLAKQLVGERADSDTQTSLETAIARGYVFTRIRKHPSRKVSKVTEYPTTPVISEELEDDKKVDDEFEALLLGLQPTEERPFTIVEGLTKRVVKEFEKEAQIFQDVHMDDEAAVLYAIEQLTEVARDLFFIAYPNVNRFDKLHAHVMTVVMIDDESNSNPKENVVRLGGQNAVRGYFAEPEAAVIYKQDVLDEFFAAQTENDLSPHHPTQTTFGIVLRLKHAVFSNSVYSDIKIAGAKDVVIPLNYPGLILEHQKAPYTQ